MANRWLELLRPKDGNWTNTAGAALAAAVSLWGIWMGFFKEILVPAVAPVNISLGLDVKKLTPQTKSGDDIPVLLTASAKNSSGKVLRINKTFWVAHAIPIERSKDYEENEIIADINKQMTESFDSETLSGTSSRRQRSTDTWKVVAFGSLFDGSEIRPNEEIKAQRLILVPDKVNGKPFEALRVMVTIPSYAKHSRLADEGLVRIVGGIRYGTTNYVKIGFCKAPRTWKKHNLRWWFDKFELPRESLEEGFQEPASRNCPYLMNDEEREQIGGQVFTSVQEVPLRASATSQ